MSTPSKSFRNSQMAFLTIFATILVVAGHCDITPDYKNTWLFQWVYSFHMPLFFLISGYLFGLTNPIERLNKTKWTDFMKKKFIRLMVPFFVIDTIIFIIKATLFSDGEMVQHPVELTIGSYLYNLFLRPIGFMWFLPCLFMIFMMAFPLWKMVKQNHIGGGIVLIISVIIYVLAFAVDFYNRDCIPFMRFSRAIYFMAFFWTGILYAEYSDVVNRFLEKNWIVLLTVSISISVLFIGNIWLRVIAGVTMSIIIGLLAADRVPSKVLDWTAFTYTIFLLSYFPQMFVRGPVYHMFPQINQYWFSALSFILGISVPVAFCIIYRVMQKRLNVLSKYSFIFGI